MLNKTLIALSAATVLASSTGAFAQYTGFSNRNVLDQQIYAQAMPASKNSGIRMTTAWQVAAEAPENKVGDRFPFLEQTYKPTSTRVGGNVMPRQHAQVGNEAPENMLGDRYLSFATVYQPVATTKVGGRKVSLRQAGNYGQYINESPENKIGDRFPLLERAYSAKLTMKHKV